MNTKIAYSDIQYAGFVLTAILSAVLSILLLTSVAEGWLSVAILTTMAIVLEVGKWCSIHDNRRLIASLLIAVSVLGSAGGLNRALTVSNDQIDHIAQMRAMVETEIEQNNQAITSYLAMERIKDYAIPLQQKNSELRTQLATLKQPEVSELSAVLSLLANVLDVQTELVTGVVILLLATLLDALGVLFVRNEPSPVIEVIEDPVVEPVVEPVRSAPTNVETLAHSYPVFKKMQLARRDRGDGVLSQRGCVRDGYRDKQVRQYFQKLSKEGIIGKNGGQFDWSVELERVRRLF